MGGVLEGVTVLLSLVNKDVGSLKECKCRRTTRKERGVVGRRERE
jgi:hypothetical protein